MPPRPTASSIADPTRELVWVTLPVAPTVPFTQVTAPTRPAGTSWRPNRGLRTTKLPLGSSVIPPTPTLSDGSPMREFAALTAPDTPVFPFANVTDPASAPTPGLSQPLLATT